MIFTIIFSRRQIFSQNSRKFCAAKNSDYTVTVEMTVNRKDVIMEVDTGAAASLMSQDNIHRRVSFHRPRYKSPPLN